MTNLQAFNTAAKNWFCFPSLRQIPKAWREQIFAHNDNPFTTEAFLLALEESACIGGESGWKAQYFVLNDTTSTALFLCYEKSHSYGEYVFDWAWADAYHRNGIHYYPKLLASVPFSPIPCSKWIGNSELSELEAFKHIAALVPEGKYTSLHYLYPKHPLKQMDNNFWIPRQGHQFHWFNQDEHGKPFESFEQYLTLMTARKRKNINKERQKVQQSGVNCYWKGGEEVSANELHYFYHCYHLTYMKRGQSGYLNKRFFELLCENLKHQVQILFCEKDEEIIAAALYLKSDDTLYGRYWGCLEHAEFVHFEACYYQGLEFAITQGLSCFNPGTQGEHKIARGFRPTTTYSYHHLYLSPFHNAVQQFCVEETKHNRLYMAECEAKLPFKKENLD